MQIYAPLEIHLGPERVGECLCVFVAESKSLFECKSVFVSILGVDSAAAQLDAACEFIAVVRKDAYWVRIKFKHRFAKRNKTGI